MIIIPGWFVPPDAPRVLLASSANESLQMARTMTAADRGPRVVYNAEQRRIQDDIQRLQVQPIPVNAAMLGTPLSQAYLDFRRDDLIRLQRQRMRAAGYLHEYGRRPRELFEAHEENVPAEAPPPSPEESSRALHLNVAA